LVRFLRLIQPPSVAEEIVHTNVSIGNELGAIRLANRRKRPRGNDRKLLAQHIGTYVDRDVAAFADEAGGAPRTGGPDRQQASLRSAGSIQRQVRAASVCQIFDRSERTVAACVDR